jgi:hypothetical protein
LSRSKVCSNCRETLPLDSFGRDSRATSGLQSQCRGCRTARVAELRHKKRRETPSSQFNVSPTAKTCPYCTKSLPSASFNKNVASADGLQTYCRPCHNFLYPDTRTGRVRPGRWRKTQRWRDRPNDAQLDDKP